MSDPVILILVSVGLALLVALWAVLMWNSRQSARYLMRAVGLILIIVGAWVTGVTQLALNGVRSLIDWFYVKVLDTPTWVGIALAAVGIVSFIIGGAIKAPTREEAKTRRLEREAKQRKRLADKAAKTTATPPITPKPTAKPSKPAEPANTTRASETTPPPVPETKPAATTPEDEIASILRKHSIE